MKQVRRSSHVEASVFTPEAISRKTFRRLTKEKAQEKLIKGKKVGLRMAERKCIDSGLLGKKVRRILTVNRQWHRLR